MNASFETRFDDLPEELPIFPLSGALLLPRCRLPLNIFEPRYLQMTEDALAADRLIGMVQPADVNSDMAAPEVFNAGCAGRITSFSETDDGRILIILTGVCRFEIAEELTTDAAYRRVVANWEPFRHDLVAEDDGVIDRERLYASLRVYFDSRGLDTDWDVLGEATDENLVNSLAMSCPFGAEEKQALLEASSLPERTELMLSLLEMASLDNTNGDLSIQ